MKVFVVTWQMLVLAVCGSNKGIDYQHCELLKGDIRSYCESKQSTQIIINSATSEDNPGTPGTPGESNQTPAPTSANTFATTPAPTASTPAPIPSPTPAPTPAPSGYLVNVYNGLCVDVAGTPPTERQDAVQTSPCEFSTPDKKTDQIWILTAEGFIRNDADWGMCIDVMGIPEEGDHNSMINGKQLQAWECETDLEKTDQKWTLEPDGFIRNQANLNKCIDVVGDPGAGWGVRLQIWDCEVTKSKTDQKWALRARPEKVVTSGYLKNLNHDYCIDVKGVPPNNWGTEVQTSGCEFDKGDAETDNRWTLNPEGFIYNRADYNRCFDVWGWPPGSMQNGKQLQISQCELSQNPTDHKWVLDANGFIRNQADPEKCIDVPGAPGENGGLRLQVWDCEFANANTDQKWEFRERPNTVTSGFLKNLQHDFCIDVLGMPPNTGGAAVQTSKCEYERGDADTDNLWTLTTDGFLRNNANWGLCMDVHGSPPESMQNGKQLEVAACEVTGNTDHKWVLDPDGFIRNQANRNKCIDVPGAPGKTGGLRLQIWDCEVTNSNTDQKWAFITRT